ncbi:AAA family ATPase [Acinetobacter pittii]|uniref:AAA family ATPase n=3 Tax=Acinetobacter pittii TaxID=48296 RepID=UPI0032601A04
MLIQFSVENYRSIKEEQTLTMVKDSPDEMPSNYCDPQVLTVPELLHSAVIYGANASGKSNLLKALLYMRIIIGKSYKKEINSSIPVEPFKFEKSCLISPTTFTISFIKNKVRYDYSFSATSKLITEEWLSAYPNGREQALYHRWIENDIDENQIDNIVYNWKFSSKLKGKVNLWKESTRSDQLFLSTAVHLNSEFLKPIYEWFVEDLRVLDSDRIMNDFTMKTCLENSTVKATVIELLKQADIDLDDIQIETKKNTVENLPSAISETFKKKYLEEYPETMDAYFVHHDSDGNKILIPLEEQSDGTQKLFEYAAPILDVLTNGYVFIIDELNKSLHPDLVRYIVKIFNSVVNTSHAQLIFTTHETSILRRDLLRRDQIWFCEKSSDKSTTVYPLTSFSPRKDREDIEESYLSGRYGGKPIVKPFSFLPLTYLKD